MQMMNLSIEEEWTTIQKNPNETTTSELMDAVNAMLLGQTPEVQYTESIGCSVKWKV